MWCRPAKVRSVLAAKVRISGSQKAFADEHSLSPQYICDVLKNRREISGRLAKILGFERHIRYWRDIK